MRRGKATFKAVKMFCDEPEHRDSSEGVAAGGILFGFSRDEVYGGIPTPTAPFYWKILERRGSTWHVIEDKIRKKL